MLSFEPYIIFIAVMALIGLLYIGVKSVSMFEIVTALFAVSTLLASLFYSNEPEWFIETQETGIGGYLRGLILVFCGLIGVTYYFLKAREHKFRVPLHLLMLSGFAVFNFASVFYSIDQSNTLVRSSLFASSFLFLLGLDTWFKTKEDFSKILNVLFIIVSIFIIVNIISIVFWPSRVWWWKAASRLIGLSSHPNALGGFTVISFPILLWKFYDIKSNAKYYVLIIVLLNFILLFLTGSRTSLAGALVTLSVWFLVYKDWIKLLSLFFAVVLGFVIISQLGFASYERTKGSRIYDLTEREYIWDGATLFAKKRPIAGYGYSVESKIFADQYLYDIEGTGLDINPQGPLHNGYLSIFIGGGVIGFLLFILTIAIPVYYLARARLSNYKAYAIATLSAILISNFVESAITGYFSPTDIFFWIAWAVGGQIGLLEKNK